MKYLYNVRGGGGAGGAEGGVGGVGAGGAGGDAGGAGGGASDDKVFVDLTNVAMRLTKLNCFTFPDIPIPDYVFTSDFPSIRHAGHGRVWATATASLGTIDAMADRRLKRYCTSAKYRRAYLRNLKA